MGLRNKPPLAAESKTECESAKDLKVKTIIFFKDNIYFAF